MDKGNEGGKKGPLEYTRFYGSSYGNQWMVDHMSKDGRTITTGDLSGVVEVGDFDPKTQQLIKGTRTFFEGGKIHSEKIEVFYSPTFYQGLIKYSENEDIDEEIGYIELGKLLKGERIYKDGLDIKAKSFVPISSSDDFFENPAEEWSITFPSGVKVLFVPADPPKFKNYMEKYRYEGETDGEGKRNGNGTITLGDDVSIEAIYVNDKIDFTKPYLFHYLDKNGGKRTYQGKRPVIHS